PPTSPSELYTLSLHDALPIYEPFVSCITQCDVVPAHRLDIGAARPGQKRHKQTIPKNLVRFFRKSFEESRQFVGLQEAFSRSLRSEEHTSELQSRGHLVCRLL